MLSHSDGVHLFTAGKACSGTPPPCSARFPACAVLSQNQSENKPPRWADTSPAFPRALDSFCSKWKRINTSFGLGNKKLKNPPPSVEDVSVEWRSVVQAFGQFPDLDRQLFGRGKQRRDACEARKGKLPCFTPACSLFLL